MSRSSTNPPLGAASLLGPDSIDRVELIENGTGVAERHSAAASDGRNSRKMRKPRNADKADRVTDAQRRESHDELRVEVVTDESASTRKHDDAGRLTPRRVHGRDRAYARRRLHVVSLSIGIAMGLTIAAAVQSARQEIAQVWPVIGASDARMDTDPIAMATPVAGVMPTK